MSDVLTFMMGDFEAEVPVDRLYAKNHMWAMPGEEAIRFGFSSYAVRLLQDVYFLDWTVDAPSTLKDRQEMGSIESKKAESSLFAPMTGDLIQYNDQLLDDPSAINVDKYGAGWLFEMSGSQDGLLEAQAYLEHLADVWEVTQRTIKGQLND